MTTSEKELKALMLASLDGSSVSYRSLLEGLSSRLRAYYKGKLGRFGRGATEVEDLVQEVLLAIHLKRHTYDAGEPFTPWVYTTSRDTSSSTICAGPEWLRAFRSMREPRSLRRMTIHMPRVLTTSGCFWDVCRKNAVPD